MKDQEEVGGKADAGHNAAELVVDFVKLESSPCGETFGALNAMLGLKDGDDGKKAKVHD